MELWDLPLRLVLLSASYLIALGGRLESTGQSPFSDLSVDEMTAVKDYLYQQTNLNLDDNYRVTSSSLLLIEAIPAPKADVLAHLDNGRPAPQRAARVVILRGDLPKPVIEECKVSPIPNPTEHELIRNLNWRDPIPFTARTPFTTTFLQFNELVEKEVAKINPILKEITEGFSMGDCGYKCLMWLPGMPAYSQPNGYELLIYLLRRIEGPYLNPIGVQILFNIEGTDTTKWHVEYVWLQGQHFKTLEEVVEMKNAGLLKIKTVPDPEGMFTENQRSSLNFRGEPRPSASQRGPRSIMPDGKRFSISERHIKWMGWEFEFSMLASSGIQLHDVKFLKERIAYELSLQEVGVFYSGGSPWPSHTHYFDSLTMLGTQTSELFLGIDCPRDAEFFDFVHYFNGNPHIFKNGACVFEHDRGVPLRRHSQSNNQGSYYNAHGMPDNVLVFRQIVTVGNYDYIVDFMFHQAGQIEGKISLTGYLLNTFYTGPEMNKYGYVVNEPTSIGNIHHHIVSIKADLDIKGQNNRFKTMDIKLEEIPDVLNKNETLLNKYFVNSLKQTELEAAYKFNFDTPKYLVMYNEEEKNMFGNSRGYRILSDGMSKLLLPKTYRGFRSRTWAEYQVAFTKQKDHEQSSSSIYASMEPYDPVLSFEDYIKDNESIVDQDLVAWLTLGTHHIPHSEDVPIVTTPGVQLTFYLLPYNYFDEDPSLASRDNIRVTPERGGNKYSYAGVTADHDSDVCYTRTSGSPSLTGSLTLSLILSLTTILRILVPAFL